MFMRLFALFALSAVALAAAPTPNPEALYRVALIAAKDKSGKALDDGEKLQFYALFKAAEVGPCNIEEPSMLDFTAWAKWDAWKNLGNISKEEAKARYVALMDEKKPGWRK